MEHKQENGFSKLELQFANLNLQKLQLIPKDRLRVLVVSKPYDNEVEEFTKKILQFLDQNSIEYLVQSHIMEQEEDALFLEKTNIIITVGGDGTLLHAVKLFYNREVPPIISFSMGSLGYLWCFEADEYQQILEDSLCNSKLIIYQQQGPQGSIRDRPIPTIDERSRLKFSLIASDGERTINVRSQIFGKSTKELNSNEYIQSLNEVTLRRHMDFNDSSCFDEFLSLELYINGEHLTDVETDGLIISTPTGSTAYSMSWGGSIVSSSIEAILITPMNPNSLSFRPIVLPNSVTVQIRIKPESVNWGINIDGDFSFTLKACQKMQIWSANSPVRLVTNPYKSSTESWIKNIRTFIDS